MATTNQSRQTGNGVLTSDQILSMDLNHHRDLGLLVERYQVLFEQHAQPGKPQKEKDDLQAQMKLIKEVLQKRPQ